MHARRALGGINKSATAGDVNLRLRIKCLRPMSELYNYEVTTGAELAATPVGANGRTIHKMR